MTNLSTRRRRLVLASALVLATLAATASPASAHPLGNLTVNSSTNLVVAPDHVHVDEVLDLAELPTVQAEQQIDANHDGTRSQAELAAWRLERCTTIAQGLHLTPDVPLRVETEVLSFPPGQGGLSTLRLECSLDAALDTSKLATLSIEDTNTVDRIGWREITAVGDGMTLVGSTVPVQSPSLRLTSYPPAFSSPLRQLSTTLQVRAGGARLGAAASTAGPTTASGKPQARGADALTRRFNRIVSDRHLTVTLGLLAALVAFLLGAIHSLAPGHGKTMMAAYVVGRRGAVRQVLTIGTTVAITHTAGVLALGLAIWTSQAVAPDRLLPWLTVASGALLVATGLGLFIRRVVLGRRGHVHPHPHAHPHGQALAHAHDAHAHPHLAEHAHHPHGHDAHAHDAHSHDAHAHDAHDHDAHDAHDHDHGRDAIVLPDAPPSRRWLVAMGVAGGLVPTPSALVVLLGAAALGRAWFGVVLVAIYGVGMAATLMAAGVAFVRLQGWLEAHWYGSRWLSGAMRWAPIVTATALVLGGVSIAVRGALAV